MIKNNIFWYAWHLFMDLNGDLRTINAFLILTSNHCKLCWTKSYCETNKRVNMQVEGGSLCGL